jgi:hypothetical protein
MVKHLKKLKTKIKNELKTKNLHEGNLTYICYFSLTHFVHAHILLVSNWGLAIMLIALEL